MSGTSPRKRVLVDVDTQIDFVEPHGALYVPAPGAQEAVLQRLRAAEAAGTPIIGSVDSHAYDAWEFEANGGPFPPHCVKGTAGWLRVHAQVPRRTRFVPMQPLGGERPDDVQTLVGEAVRGEGPRMLDAAALAGEAVAGVGLYFEKEVYSLFSNPAASPLVAALVEALGGPEAVVFEVIGYCTGGYCVDAAVSGLLERGYTVHVHGPATAAIGGSVGAESSRRDLSEAGATWLEE